MERKKWKNKNIFQAFQNSVNGIKYTFRNERSLKIQVAFSLLASVLAIVLGFNSTQLAILFITIGFVLFAELINTALEVVMDLYSEEYNEKIKNVKDISSGAVFVTAIVSASVGVVLFLPKILDKLI